MAPQRGRETLELQIGRSRIHPVRRTIRIPYRTIHRRSTRSRRWNHRRDTPSPPQEPNSRSVGR